MKPRNLACLVLLLGGCPGEPQPTPPETAIVIEVTIEGQSPRRFESEEGWIAVHLDERGQLDAVAVANQEVVFEELEDQPELLEAITWLLAFGFDDAVPFQTGSVSNTLLDPIVGTTAIGSFAVPEHGKGETVQLLAVDTEAETVSLAYSSPLEAVSSSLCLGELRPCDESEWTPATGTLTATITGPYDELRED